MKCGHPPNVPVGFCMSHFRLAQTHHKKWHQSCLNPNPNNTSLLTHPLLRHPTKLSGGGEKSHLHCTKLQIHRDLRLTSAWPALRFHKNRALKMYTEQHKTICRCITWLVLHAKVFSVCTGKTELVVHSAHMERLQICNEQQFCTQTADICELPITVEHNEICF